MKETIERVDIYNWVRWKIAYRKCNCLEKRRRMHCRDKEKTSRVNRKVKNHI